MRISVEDNASPQDVQTVERGLEAFNLARTGVSSQFERISIFVRGDDGDYGDYAGQYYYQLVDRNGRNIAESGAFYASRKERDPDWFNLI